MNTKRTAIFYGSTTGTTKDVAHRIGRMMGIPENDIFNVKDVSPSRVGEYQNIIAGTSTWGNGDLQVDWYDFVDGLGAIDLKKAKVAIFGCGDETMSDTFCDGVAKLYDAFKSTGAGMVGEYNADGYSFKHTAAERDGHFLGLLLDEVNHPEYTDLRLRGWTAQIKDQFTEA